MSRKSKRWAKREEHHCTRRDFLKTGASSAAFFTVPTLLHSFLRAETAQAEGLVTWLGQPFCHMHLSGGYSAAHVALGLDSTGAELGVSSLINIGHNDTALTRFTQVGQLKFFNDSFFTRGFVTGLGLTLPATIPAAIQAVMLCGTSGDDNTAGAKYGFVAAHAYSGLTSAVAATSGLSNTPSGNGTFPLANSAGSDFIFARTVGDVINASSFSTTLTDSKYFGLIADGVKRIYRAQISSRQSEGTLAKFFRNMVGGIPDKLIEKVTPPNTPASMNAQQTGSQALTAYPNLTAKDVATVSPSNNSDEREAAVVYNTLLGNLGGVSFSIDGYDYHGNADTQTSVKDETAGLKVGRACRLAMLLGKSLWFVVTTDGGLSSNNDFNRNAAPGTINNASRWQGDRRAFCRTYLFLVNMPPVTSYVIGHLNANGTTNESTPVGQDFLVSAVIMASYMVSNGRSEDEIKRTLKGMGLTETQITDVRAKVFV